jgi:hypothetical protein
MWLASRGLATAGLELNLILNLRNGLVLIRSACWKNVAVRILYYGGVSFSPLSDSPLLIYNNGPNFIKQTRITSKSKWKCRSPNCAWTH